MLNDAKGGLRNAQSLGSINQDLGNNKNSKGSLGKNTTLTLDISEINWQNLSRSRLSRGSDDYSNTEKILLDNLKSKSRDSRPK